MAIVWLSLSQQKGLTLSKFTEGQDKLISLNNLHTFFFLPSISTHASFNFMVTQMPCEPLWPSFPFLNLITIFLPPSKILFSLWNSLPQGFREVLPHCGSRKDGTATCWTRKRCRLALLGLATSQKKKPGRDLCPHAQWHVSAFRLEQVTLCLSLRISDTVIWSTKDSLPALTAALPVSVILSSLVSSQVTSKP